MASSSTPVALSSATFILLLAGGAVAEQAPVAPAPTVSAAPAPSPPSAAAPAGSSTPPVGAAPAAAVATAPAPPPPPGYAVPPGYMLVPAPTPEAQTRYDVQYPQGRGALPPGMELPYVEGEPIPPGYRLVEQRRRGLIIAGSIVLGVPWVFGVTAATAADFKDGTGLLLIPVLGPWLTLTTDVARDKPCDPGTLVCETRAATRAVLVLDGMVQAGGAAMLVVGLFVPKKRLVRRNVIVSVAPLAVGRDGYGLGVSGSF